MMQKTNINGNTLWDSPIIITEESAIYASRFLTICPSDSQPIITWIIDETIFSQKIDSDGNKLWGEESIIVFESNYDFNKNSVFLEEAYDNGCVLCWTDYSYGYDESKILVQKLNSDGDLLFGEDGMILYENSDYFNYQLNSSLATTNQKYYLCWLDNTDDSQSLIHQIIDEEGNIYLEENGEEMFNGLSGSSYDIQLLSNEDNPIILWSDGRSFNNYRIYLQILNSDGSTVFTEDGIPITTNSQYEQLDLNAVFGENSGTIAAIWSENRVGCKQIYAQGIDISGNLLWADSTGICLTSANHFSEKPKMSVIDNSGTDEYYIGWEDFTDWMDSRICGQKIINGNLEWGEYGKVIVDREYNDELTDIKENYYIWQSDGYQNENIFCIKVDENGDPAPGWSEDGLEICIAEGRQREARGIVVPQGLLILWEDYRNGDIDIYGQIITPDGNILWQENGLPLIEQENDQDNFNFIYDNGLHVVWQDFRSGTNYEIYAQKFDEYGNELWQEGGVLIADVNEINYENPDLAKVGNSIIIVWEERIDYWIENIRAQLVNKDGELLWQPQGIFICDMFMEHHYPKVVSNGDDDVYIAWQDGRSTFMGDEGLCLIPGIYAQKMHIEPTSVDDELVKPIEILSNYPNPFNPETTISFSVTQTSSFVTIDIFKIKGE